MDSANNAVRSLVGIEITLQLILSINHDHRHRHHSSRVRPCGPVSPSSNSLFNPLNPELSPICYLLALLAHHFLHVSRIRVKSLTLRLLMSYIYIYIYIYICMYIERLFLMFLDHTQRRSTVGRTPLDE